MQHTTTQFHNLLSRIISSIVLVSLFVTSILWFAPLFYVLIVLIAIAMLYEWYQITKTNIIHLLSGLIIIPVPIASLILINCQKHHIWLLLGYLILIWSVDSFAMIGGKILQGPKLAPILSPKKTWSGLVVGVICAILSVALFNVLTSYAISNYYRLGQLHMMLYTGVLAIIAQVSDLFVSYFKRYHHVKNSGTIIPGHGGALDRFDSIILTAPILFYIIYIL